MEFGPILRAMRRNKTRIGLIVFEIALTLAIVANCVTMIADARTKMVRRSGFDDLNIVRSTSQPFDKAFKEDGYLDNSLREDLEAIRALPGVKAVSNTNFLPWQGGGSSTELRPQGTKGEPFRTQIYNADEATFDALGIRIVQGRGFTRDEVAAEALRLRKLFASPRAAGSDGRPAEKITQDVVISEAYGKLVWGEGQPLLGRLLEDDDGDMYRVVGTIDQFYNPYGWPIHEYVVFYATIRRSYEGGVPYLVRTEPGQAAAVGKAIEERLVAVNGGRNVRSKPLEETKDQFFAGQKIVVTMMTSVIVLLIFITSLGIVGLTSFSVAERTRQIGTRRALGARKVDILRHFLLENWLITTMGLLLGAGLAYGLNIGLVSFAAGARLSGWLVLGGVGLLWAAGAAATLAPALRASRISPAIATRNV
jgi:putative ABC transport system permease protein